MMRTAILCGTFAAVCLAPLSVSFAAGHGGMGGAPMGGFHSTMGGTMTSPTMTTSSTTTTTSTVRGPTSTGQPNQSCQAAGSQTPGNAANSPGSPFNTSGVAGTHYAGQQPQNSMNSASVAQYDVACTKGGR